MFGDKHWETSGGASHSANQDHLLPSFFSFTPCNARSMMTNFRAGTPTSWVTGVFEPFPKKRQNLFWPFRPLQLLQQLLHLPQVQSWPQLQLTLLPFELSIVCTIKLFHRTRWWHFPLICTPDVLNCFGTLIQLKYLFLLVDHPTAEKWPYNVHQC